MASYVTKKILCPCCGQEFEGKVLKGFFHNNVMGLDRNPHTPAIYDTILICPHCGYASSNMSKSVSERIRQLVYSTPYLELKNSMCHDSTLAKIILAAKLLEEANESKAAADTYLMGYWYSLETGTSNAEYLNKPIHYYSLYLKNNADISTGIAFIDCLRQAKLFKEAMETAESLITFTENKQLQKIISYELRLIKENDAAPHLVSEVHV